MNEVSPLRIALIVDGFPRLAETFILRHVTGLLSRGCDVTVFARRTEPQPYIHPSFHSHRLNERTVYLPHQERSVRQLLHLPGAILGGIRHPDAMGTLNFIKYGYAAFRLRAFYGLSSFQNHKFDIVHCHYGHVGRAFIPLKDILHVPYITSFHGAEFSRLGRATARLYRPLFELADAIIANSGFTRRSLLTIGCPPAKIQLIPALSGIGGHDLPIRHQRKIRTILTVARLDEDKGIQHCLDAIHHLAETSPDLQYVVVGDGPYRSALENRVRDLGLSERVRLTGWLPTPEVRREYESADLFVLPSIPPRSNGCVETQGVVIQEAQMFGLPVIASAIGGIPESLDDGRAGILVEPGNGWSLSRAIEGLLRSPDRAQELATAGAKYCQSHYNPDVILDALLDLYSSLGLSPLNDKATGTFDPVAI